MSPESSPIQPSPSKRVRMSPLPNFAILEDEDACSDVETVDLALGEASIPLPIRRTKALGSTARILQRSFGGMLDVGRGRLRDHCTNWQDHTADFYTGPEDFHPLPPQVLPFCTASCNRNSLVAIGDEEGWIHLVDTNEAQASFSQSHMSVQLHSNAVMDADFSSDDLFLATASGDQTAQIMDIRTQRCVSILAKHTSSVKQVCFQPGDDKVLATSSRDGTVQIWDLRCSGGSEGVVHSIWGENAPYASTVRTLSGAHTDNSFVGGPASTSANSKGSKALGKSEAISRRGEISITAVSFLPPSREHLLLTASDASTCVKLWDIRGRYSRRGPAVPISTTRQPESHNRHRHFAVNSLALSSDGARLYALSRDNTIYAYATSHLVLGQAPELTLPESTRQRHVSAGKEGLGPIYGFRHRKFHAASFYVKASLRKATGDKPELLAVGSTDGCPVLFPTDETFLKQEADRENDDSPLPKTASASVFNKPRLMRSSSDTGFPARMTDTIPIYEHGTPLIRGHQSEVTNVTWTKDGALVSVGDDYRARCWREGSQARELRLSGEAGGRRWASGWADIEAGYDDDE